MTESSWSRNVRFLRHYRQYVKKMTIMYEILNSKAPTKVHKATNEENEYYQSILDKSMNKSRYFDPLKTVN